MPEPQDIDSLLRDWPFQPGTISARVVTAGNGRDVLQMRVEMGVLQMEMTGRPDGQRPGGYETFLDFLNAIFLRQGEHFMLTEEHCTEIDREFLQFYHRRICRLALRDFRGAVEDSDHSLSLMDFVTHWSNDHEWIASHEQYRPFVLFHRSQAAALAAIEEGGPENAVAEIATGLEKIREIFVKLGAEDQFDTDELVVQLTQMKEALRTEYGVGKTLAEQLADAVASEEYERAARLRDEIARREVKQD